MTRKDYVLIAKAITDTQARIKAHFERGIKEHGSAKAEALLRSNMAEQLRGVRRAAAHICDALAADNPRFDLSRFLKACGYGAMTMNPTDPALDLRPLPNDERKPQLHPPAFSAPYGTKQDGVTPKDLGDLD